MWNIFWIRAIQLDVVLKTFLILSCQQNFFMILAILEQGIMENICVKLF